MATHPDAPAVPSATTWTVRAVLDEARRYLERADVDNPRLDAELLLACALQVRRLELYLRFDQPLSPAEREPFKALLRRRAAHEPVAYLLGEREFYGLAMQVNRSVLIPRPETEILVDEVLKRMVAAPPKRLLDLCTGSGCIAVALLHTWTEAHAIATDLAAAALRVADANARRHGVRERLALVRCDLATPLTGTFDLVVSNPPYIATGELATLPADVRDHEPRLALAAGDDGLDHSRRLAAWLPGHLAAHGVVAVECADARGPATAQLLRDALGATHAVDMIPDLSGRPRVAVGVPSAWIG